MTTLHYRTSNRKQQNTREGAPSLPGQDEHKEPTVYLLHFHTALGNEKHTALHYIGFSGNLDERVRAHRNGTSYAKIMTALYERKISFSIARTWPGGRELERALKASKQYARYCPICQMEKLTRTMFPTPVASLFATVESLSQVEAK